MNLRHIALASAVVAAGPAFAATGSLNALYGVTAARTIYVSGASALSGSLAAAVGALCTGGSANVKVHGIGGTTSYSDGRVAVCTTSSAGPAAGLYAGPFAVVKRDTDGSFAGVGPVISGTALTKWADVNNCDSTALTCALDTTTAIVPAGGLSDVETAVWQGLNKTGALAASVPTSTAGITKVSGFAAQGFGVMVSEELYKAMQNVQKADGRLASSCVTGDFTAGACQPSISKAEYAAIARADNANYVVNAGVSGSATDPINLCRRVETSGTQASSNVFFLNNACSNASPTFGAVNPKFVDFTGGGVNPVTFSSSAGQNVSGNYDDFGGAFGLFEGSGTGDARNCVINRNNGQNPNKVADGLGKFAIGWISLENAPAAGWKLVKLDGVSPNAYQTAAGWVADSNQRVNVAKGLYDAMFEFEMIYPTAGTHAGFFGALKTAFADPTVLNTRGIVIAPGTFTHSSNPTLVAKGTRNGNNCAPQSLSE